MTHEVKPYSNNEGTLRAVVGRDPRAQRNSKAEICSGLLERRKVFYLRRPEP